MDSIYKYENYRQYLQDYFNEKKDTQKSFSNRYFARKCGFSSHSYCRMVINGERNLSSESVEKISKALGLKAKEAQYFKLLVNYQQSNNLEEKECFYRLISKFGKSTEHYKLNQEHARYFKNWYFPVIRHLAVYAEWEGSYTRLASLVCPKISANEAKEAVETLESMGLLVKKENGEYSMSSKVVSSKNIPSFLKRKARKEILEKGLEATEAISPDIRYTAYTTISISKETYSNITDSMNRLREEIIEQSVRETRADRVYELIFQLFPVSEQFINSVSSKKEKICQV